jgi:hypothetical protein
MELSGDDWRTSRGCLTPETYAAKTMVEGPLSFLLTSTIVVFSLEAEDFSGQDTEARENMVPKYL